MKQQAKIYRGSSFFLTLEVYDVDGNKLEIDVSGLTLIIVRPDGGRITYTSDFITMPDLSVRKLVTIPENAPTGTWRAIWKYVDEYGTPWINVITFIVIDPVRD